MLDPVSSLTPSIFCKTYPDMKNVSFLLLSLSLSRAHEKAYLCLMLFVCLFFVPTDCQQEGDDQSELHRLRTSQHGRHAPQVDHIHRQEPSDCGCTASLKEVSLRPRQLFVFDVAVSALLKLGSLSFFLGGGGLRLNAITRPVVFPAEDKLAAISV